MPGGATIGALRFVLGADTAAFERNLKNAEGSLKRIAVVGAAVGTAIGNALTAAFASIARSVNKALTDADRMGEIAEAIGVSVESLSRLKHAAELSGASLETLQGSITRLSRNMMEAATNATSTAARSFDALGISVTNAAGQLKNADQLLLEVADKFAGIQDGAGKTALAVNLFGRSGADLIPLLNRGSVGIREMGAEADRLGITLSAGTAKAAGEFKDGLDRLGKVVQGIFLQLAERFLPTLQRVVDMFSRWTQESTTLQVALVVLEGVFKAIVTALVVLNAAAETVIDVLKRLWAAITALSSLDFKGAMQSFSGHLEGMDTRARALIETLKGIWLETNNVNTATGNLGAQGPLAQAPFIASTQQLGAAMRAARDEARFMLDEIINAPTETFVAKMAAIEQALRNGTITMRNFGEMTRRVQKENQQHMFDLASATATALTTIFGKNKAASIAAAIINTSVGITKALATLPPPFSWAQAALIAASGAAQIATIKSTNESGGGGRPSVSGSSGGGGGEQQAGSTQTLMVQGINPNQIFSGEVMRDFAQKLLDFQKDGGVVVLK